MALEIELQQLAFDRYIRPGDTVCWGQSSAEPLVLTQHLMEQRHTIGGRFRVFLGIGQNITILPEHTDCIDAIGYCATGSNRKLSTAGKLDILPCHYSKIPELIRHGLLKIDVLLLQLAGPNSKGEYSLSIAHDYLYAALDSARVIIAEVNSEAPWTHGSRTLTEDQLDIVVHSCRTIDSPTSKPATETETQIASRIAGLIQDGSTLQFGLGSLPQAVLSQLGSHRHLGIHSGTISDAVIDQIESGVIDNSRKGRDTGVTVTGLLGGTGKLLQYAHCNPTIQLRPVEYTHHPEILASLPQFIAINSAIEVDISGQINAEVAGSSYVGAVGGAMDFLRAAHRSRGGLPIIALPSMAGKTSRIVSKVSGPVSTPRSDAGIIITEYGIADLRGLSVKERARKMLDIAHPAVRDELAEISRV